MAMRRDININRPSIREALGIGKLFSVYRDPLITCTQKHSCGTGYCFFGLYNIYRLTFSIVALK